mmetsp:Transcript_117014/g.372493  ORF Transcript_117014/g.372493 Transcript_117014/m.372493 type:complete len:317 (+) Transcript_117014:1017-1967(+)
MSLLTQALHVELHLAHPPATCGAGFTDQPPLGGSRVVLHTDVVDARGLRVGGAVTEIEDAVAAVGVQPALPPCECCVRPLCELAAAASVQLALLIVARAQAKVDDASTIVIDGATLHKWVVVLRPGDANRLLHAKKVDGGAEHEGAQGVRAGGVHGSHLQRDAGALASGRLDLPDDRTSGRERIAVLARAEADPGLSTRASSAGGDPRGVRAVKDAIEGLQDVKAEPFGRRQASRGDRLRAPGLGEGVLELLRGERAGGHNIRGGRGLREQRIETFAVVWAPVRKQLQLKDLPPVDNGLEATQPPGRPLPKDEGGV